MEQDGAIETVYYVETPYATNEEEIATSYITVESEEGIETAEVIEHAEVIENAEMIETDEGIENAEIIETDEGIETIEDAEIVENEGYDSSFDNPIGSDDNSVPDEILLAQKTDDNNIEIDEPQLTVECEVTASDSTSDLSCRICSKTFTKPSNKQRHVRRVHNIRRQNGTSIKCIECDSNFSQISRLRSHLTEHHQLEMKEEYLRFPSMDGK